jgi:hypothetical protein
MQNIDNRVDDLELTRVRTLGSGHSATVYLSIDKDQKLYAEKVRQSSGFSQLVYALSFQAPTPDRNEHAVKSAVLTRNLLTELTNNWNSEDRRIPLMADAIGYKWNHEEKTYSLITEFIQGRGPKPNTDEIDILMDCMDALQENLFKAGLYGPAWQADKSNMTSTSNFKITSDGSAYWIDTEPGMIAMSFAPGKKYIKAAKKKGFTPLFADIDFEKLRDYLVNEPINGCLENTVDQLELNMRIWKSSELALLRNSGVDKQRMHKWYVDNWTHERNLCGETQELLQTNTFAFGLYSVFGKFMSIVANKEYRDELLENKFRSWEEDGVIPVGSRKFPRLNTLLSAVSPKVVHHYLMDPDFRKYINKGIFSRKHRKRIASDFIDSAIDDYKALGRFTPEEAQEKREWLKKDSEVMDVYLTGFGTHLLLKGATLPADVAFIANILGTSGLDFLEPLTIEALLMNGLPYPLNTIAPLAVGPALRLGYTGYSALRCKLENRDVPHKAAAVMSPLKGGFGNSAFAVQMAISEDKFTLEYLLHKIGKKVPIFGGVDSRIDHKIMRGAPLLRGTGEWIEKNVKRHNLTSQIPLRF